jgi:hypothetical protein
VGEDEEDHEVEVVDEAVLAVDYRPPHRVVVRTGMILLLLLLLPEDRVLGVIVLPVLVLAWTTFETMRVKATTVKGVFTIVGVVAVVVVEDSLAAADVVMEVAA